MIVINSNPFKDLPFSYDRMLLLSRTLYKSNSLSDLECVVRVKQLRNQLTTRSWALTSQASNIDRKDLRYNL